MDGTITIGSKTWAVTVARTAAELASGLSGRTSLDAYHGILFDIGGAPGRIKDANVDLSQMLFNLDVISIGETGATREITDIHYNVAPGQTGIVVFGVRYFLEINAGEAAEAIIGEAVTFDDDMSQQLLVAAPVSIDISSLMSLMVTMMIVTMMMKMMTGAIKQVR